MVGGAVAGEAPEMVGALVEAVGAERVIAAVDVRDGVVRVDGWQRAARSSLDAVMASLAALGITESLVTDISKDGVMRGPSFALYRELAKGRGEAGAHGQRVEAAASAARPFSVIASGGVSTVGDVVSLARIPNVGACLLGRALLD